MLEWQYVKSNRKQSVKDIILATDYCVKSGIPLVCFFVSVSNVIDR